MFKEILKALWSVIFDGFKYLMGLIGIIIVFTYIFSAFGAFFLVMFLGDFTETTPYTYEWFMYLIGITIILLSWVLFLIIEVLSRVQKQKRYS